MEKRLSHSQHVTLIELRDKGWKLKDIAHHLDISVTTAWAYAHRTPQEELDGQISSPLQVTSGNN